MPHADPDELLSPAQAAAITGVSVHTLRRYNREGRLDAIRTPGGQRRFRRSDLVALMAAAAEGGEAQ